MDGFLWDYWVYNKVWNNRDIFDPEDTGIDDDEYEEIEEEQQERRYNTNSSEGSSREY